ncbi:plasminogen activator inhibitor 1 RNA-binding protein-like isoform X2 [Cotesia glomerata]|uniref:plasminogen activator inhibitor 1 RNA-binding protein-like isoform X2 n=1 Tax=Cotesia glomerata TaxID=32391 RepID=UPI001D018D21|nr:plasminogen activator inhibitor 1 RNA-binding protein-like isoform X2 [Cotesia glomerata]
MENTYSITVTNKFLLALDEDEDPLELLKVREQEKEAKKKEKLSEKENKSKQPEAPAKTPGVKPQKSRVIKDAQQQQVKPNQELKKDQVEKKPAQPRSGGDRNVKFSGESREDHNNRRNREDGDRPPRAQGEYRRGPSGEGRENREFRGSNDGPRGDFSERRSARGGPRGGGAGERGLGPRGGRGGSRGHRSGFDNRGKREFDRQSGSDRTHAYSGVKPVDKKDGAGSHNWGSHNDDIAETLNQENNEDWSNLDKPEEVPTTSTETKDSTEAPASAGDASAEEKPAEEETKELTYDEWKALRGNRAKPTYNLRKAGEGEDLTRWKKMYALEKKKEGAEEEDDEEEEYDAAAEYPQRVGRQKRVYEIEIQFSDSRRGAGGRGGRGGRGRGDRMNGRGFGGNRGGMSRDDTRIAADVIKAPAPVVEQRSPRGRPQNAPKVDDEHDFPSLG